MEVRRAAYAAMDRERERTAPPAAEDVPGRGETILLVEDNQDLAEVYREVLGCLGYRVLAAATGEQALDVARGERGRVALVLTDLTLPGMSGTELGGTLHACGIGAPVIVLSGYPCPGGGAGAEITAWLQKPLEVEELLAAVDRALHPPRA